MSLNINDNNINNNKWNMQTDLKSTEQNQLIVFVRIITIKAIIKILKINIYHKIYHHI